jgi:hypothetical protein
MGDSALVAQAIRRQQAQAKVTMVERVTTVAVLTMRVVVAVVLAQ